MIANRIRTSLWTRRCSGCGQTSYHTHHPTRFGLWDLGRSLDFYRVQDHKGWWRRKWQAEWEPFVFAQRGYTRPGVAVMAAIRRSNSRVDAAYCRIRIVARRLNGYDDGSYRTRYTVTGRPRISKAV
jgi:hypothetical protein